MNPAGPDRATTEAFIEVLEEAMVLLAASRDWPQFRDAFRQQVGDRIPAALPLAPQEAQAMVPVLARALWRGTPDPAQGWRPRAAAEPGRNDPCHCGSGRKYKQCCGPRTHNLGELPLEPVMLGGQLFLHGPADWREPAALRRMPGDMLAAAAQAWGQENGPESAAGWLEPVFDQPAGLGDRHEQVLDVLVDLLQQAGQEARREAVLRRVGAEATARALRCAAWARLATVLSDRGEFEAAWDGFRQAQRADPDNPQLLHLELMLLLGEDRVEDARARAPVLAARARRAGLDELADLLLRLPDEGSAALLDAFRDDEDMDGQEEAWTALLQEPLRHRDAAAFAEVHRWEPQAEVDGRPTYALALTPAAMPVLKDWRRRFPVAPPVLVQLWSDAGALLEEAAEATAWLRQHPAGALAVPLLDDLLLAVVDMRDQSDAPSLAQAAHALAFAAADAIVAGAEPLGEQALLPWSAQANRPVLRVVMQAAVCAMELADDDRIGRYARWLLQHNPDDNHGVRSIVWTSLLKQGEAAEALALLDRYADELPPAGHDRVLALWLLGRHAEAEQALRTAHGEHPEYVLALLPEALDRPAETPGVRATAGSPQHAWDWRERVRALWVRAGALQWLRGLDLPPPPAKPRLPAAKKGQGTTPKAQMTLAAGREVLAREYGAQRGWLLGWLAAFAWAPDMVMPTVWIEQALERVQGEVKAELLEALMTVSNGLSDQRLGAKPGSSVPLRQAWPEAQADADWIGFAAGFVQASETHARAAWRSARVSVDPGEGPFAPLYRLAARAPAGPDDWRAETAAGQPILGLVADEAPVFDLLSAAVQPLWKASVARK